MHRAEPFKLTSFESETAALVEATKKKIQDLLAQAKREADVLKEKASKEGMQAGRETGVAQGREAEIQRIAKETAGLGDLLKAVTAGIEEKRRGLAATAEEEIMKLAIAIAERVIKKALRDVPGISAENLRHAVSLAVDRRTLEVRLHPDDRERIESYLPDLKRHFSEIKSIDLVDDPEVSPGGCIVVTEVGRVDADLRNQLDEIERQLLS